MVYSTYEYKGEQLEDTTRFSAGTTYPPGAMGHIEYNNVKSVRIENTEGQVLAEYSPDFLMKTRNAYRKAGKIKTNQESWIFTEKGLFLKTQEIRRKYNHNKEMIMRYYQSDEAVLELEEVLRNGMKNN
jgi:hypothetical protein